MAAGWQLQLPHVTWSRARPIARARHVSTRGNLRHDLREQSRLLSRGAESRAEGKGRVEGCADRLFRVPPAAHRAPTAWRQRRPLGCRSLVGEGEGEGEGERPLRCESPVAAAAGASHEAEAAVVAPPLREARRLAPPLREARRRRQPAVPSPPPTFERCQ